MSQRDFAAGYGIPLRSIENWSREGQRAAHIPGNLSPMRYLQIKGCVKDERTEQNGRNLWKRFVPCGCQLCNDEDADIIKSYQSSWDAGESFTQAGMRRPLFRPSRRRFGGEIIACVDALYQALILAVKKHWASALSRNRSRDTLQHSSQCPWWKRRLYNLQGCPCVLLRPRGSLELRPSQRRANRVSSSEYHLKEVKT